MAHNNTHSIIRSNNTFTHSFRSPKRLRRLTVSSYDKCPTVISQIAYTASVDLTLDLHAEKNRKKHTIGHTIRNIITHNIKNDISIVKLIRKV